MAGFVRATRRAHDVALGPIGIAMFIVLLRFSSNKHQAGRFIEGHKRWIKRGFDEGVFLLAGSLEPGSGGAILAHNTSASALERRVGEDPFVAEHVVSAEILQLTPSTADKRLSFLLN